MSGRGGVRLGLHAGGDGCGQHIRRRGGRNNGNFGTLRGGLVGLRVIGRVCRVGAFILKVVTGGGGRLGSGAAHKMLLLGGVGTRERDCDGGEGGAAGGGSREGTQRGDGVRDEREHCEGGRAMRGHRGGGGTKCARRGGCGDD